MIRSINKVSGFSEGSEFEVDVQTEVNDIDLLDNDSAADELADSDDLVDKGVSPEDAGSEAEIRVIELETGIRLDLGVTQVLGKSRSFAQSLISDENVLVNGVPKKANYKVREGDHITVRIPAPRALSVEPENIKLDILYEDNDIILVNKPQGMVVHPAPGAWTGTLVNALLYHCRDLSGINGVLRPGIVHRIDKDTSGILVVAKNDEAHRSLAEQIKAHSVTRKYQAIVHGMILEPSGTVDAPIGRDPAERKRMAVTFQNSKAAKTHYFVLERFDGFTHILAKLETGRTHQIRVHMAYLKHPVLGDPVYGPKKNLFNLKAQVLHAAHLGLKHPRTGEWLEFDASLPQTFLDVLEKLQSP